MSGGGRGLAWGVFTLAALWWPSRVAGPFDGAPLDGRLESVASGLLVPVLWWCHSRFLSLPRARIAIAVLLLLKASAAGLLSQDGWCVRFDLGEPILQDGTTRPHSWDVRADWRAPNPHCSAVMTRGYPEFKTFPAWFFNLRPVVGNQQGPTDRPPYATFDMRVFGYFETADSGAMDVQIGPYMDMTWLVDGQPAQQVDALAYRQDIGPGLHFFEAHIVMRGDRWRFMTSWNQAPLGSAAFPTATTTRPRRFDTRAVRLAVRWTTASIGLLLVLMWLASAFQHWRHAESMIWAGASAAWLGYLAPRPGNDYVTSEWARWSITGLALAALIGLPARLRNRRGAFFLIGLPWLVFIGVAAIDHADKFSFYHAGDDQWTFQRYAYRIFLEGYWLEGGQQTFWFQPLYRWIAGALHMLFGDTSIGEFFWDGVCFLVCALFAHDITRRVAGFRWGIVASTLTLTLIMRGPTWDFWGVGLSENASAGFIYMAALTALNARRWPAMLAAGALATLGFYTRLNNLPIALGVAAFAIPARIAVHDLALGRRWLREVRWRLAAVVAATMAVGAGLFALRTWYYTGIFSILHGTQFGHLSVWQPGMSAWDAAARMADSAFMVLSLNDPPRVAWYSIPLLAAAVSAIGAFAGVRVLRDLPLSLVLFFLAGCSGALVARGTAYAGRFSTILIGAGCAVTVCVLARMTANWKSDSRQRLDTERDITSIARFPAL